MGTPPYHVQSSTDTSCGHNIVQNDAPPCNLYRLLYQETVPPQLLHFPCGVGDMLNKHWTRNNEMCFCTHVQHHHCSSYPSVVPMLLQEFQQYALGMLLYFSSASLLWFCSTDTFEPSRIRDFQPGNCLMSLMATTCLSSSTRTSMHKCHKAVSVHLACFIECQSGVTTDNLRRTLSQVVLCCACSTTKWVRRDCPKYLQ